MIFLQLFWEFFKTGLFAVGGGMATIPFLYNMSDATNWFTHNDLANMIAISESTPGPIGVNMASYVGFITGAEVGGVAASVLGAVVATLGLITPCVIVILLISLFLKSFRNNKYVNSAFYGLRPASAGLITAAGLTVALGNLFTTEVMSFATLNWKGIVLGVVLWLLITKVKQTKKLHPIVFIAASAVVGIVLGM